MGLKSKKGDTGEPNGDSGLRDADFSQLDEQGAVDASAASPSEAANEPDLAAASAETSKLKAELADAKDRYLRTLADMENFRKRTAKERSELLKYQGEPIIVDILEVVDSFERALEFADGDPAKFKEGIKLIHKQFSDVLGKWEIKADSAIGKSFDPNRQRAIGKAKVDGVAANSVIGELKKAYVYKDRLIRFGEVMVAEGESPAEGEPKKDEGAAQ